MKIEIETENSEKAEDERLDFEAEKIKQKFNQNPEDHLSRELDVLFPSTL